MRAAEGMSPRSKLRTPADASRSAARNQRLVDACDVLVAFWDGSSKGTRATVERALDSGKEVHVFVGTQSTAS